MTTIMPHPLQSLKWTIEGLDKAVQNSVGKAKIEGSDADTIKYFKEGFNRKDITQAMEREISWLNGATFPWAVDSGADITKPRDESEKLLLSFAKTLQTKYNQVNDVLISSTRNKTISFAEGSRLDRLMEAMKVGLETLSDSLQNLSENRANNRPAHEIFEVIKNGVNVPGNDKQFGPFGMLVKFGSAEAKDFLQTLNFQVQDYDKRKEVIELLFDTASSPYGNLVLDRQASEAFKAEYDHLGLDWSKAVDAYKEEHPIVALYAVRINDEIASGSTDVRSLEAMLRAGEAAHAELSVGFVRNGPVALAGVTLSGDNAVAASMSRRERAQHVDDLGQSLAQLRARIAELRS